jgi:penicillin-binding protein 1C
MHEISGISGAAPIWHDFMEAALKGQPVSRFERPKRLVEVEVCALSGLRPGSACPHHVTELFLEGTEPAETCTLHQRVAIDRATGLRATAGTPPDRVVERLYTVLPPEAQEWAREQGLPEPPPLGESVQGGSGAAPTSLEAPEGAPLTMNGPDAGAVYRLDRALPRDAQRIEVSVRAAAGVSLVQVTLLVDGQPLAELAAPPYRAMWPLEAGTHQFSAQGVSATGQILLSDSTRIEVRE